MWMTFRTTMARMLCTDDNYRYDFEEVNNAVETESDGEDENDRTVGTKCEAYGEDESKNISCNESQSIAASLKPKRGKKEMDMTTVMDSGVKRTLKRARNDLAVWSDENTTVETCLPESEAQQFCQLVYL